MCKSFLLVFFLGLFFSVQSGFSQDDQTLKELDGISIQLTEISKTYNELVIRSQLTLQDLQKILPELIQNQEKLTTDLIEVSAKIERIQTRSNSSLEKLANLNESILSLSGSVALLGTSLSMLERSIEAMERTNRIGLFLGGGALLGVLALTVKEIYSAFK